jgi:hypothetical protein
MRGISVGQSGPTCPPPRNFTNHRRARVDGGAIRASRTDRPERGEGVAGSLLAPVDAPQGVAADRVAAVEVPHAVGAVVGGGTPLGLSGGGPARPTVGRMPSGWVGDGTPCTVSGVGLPVPARRTGRAVGRASGSPRNPRAQVVRCSLTWATKAISSWSVRRKHASLGSTSSMFHGVLICAQR